MKEGGRREHSWVSGDMLRGFTEVTGVGGLHQQQCRWKEVGRTEKCTLRGIKDLAMAWMWGQEIIQESLRLLSWDKGVGGDEMESY